MKFCWVIWVHIVTKWKFSINKQMGFQPPTRRYKSSLSFACTKRLCQDSSKRREIPGQMCCALAGTGCRTLEAPVWTHSHSGLLPDGHCRDTSKQWWLHSKQCVFLEIHSQFSQQFSLLHLGSKWVMGKRPCSYVACIATSWTPKDSISCIPLDHSLSVDSG